MSFVLFRRTHPVQRDSRLRAFGSIGFLLEVLNLEHATCVVQVRVVSSSSWDPVGSVRVFSFHPCVPLPSLHRSSAEHARAHACVRSFLSLQPWRRVSLPLPVRPTVLPFRFSPLALHPPTWCLDLSDLVRPRGVAVPASERHALRHRLAHKPVLCSLLTPRAPPGRLHRT